MTDQSCRFKVWCSCIKPGSYLFFPTFTVGEHFWRINLYPGKLGALEGEIDYLSFSLIYGGQWKDVKVNFDFDLVKKDEAAPSLVKWKRTTHTFPNCGDYFSLQKVIQGDELKRYLKDDYFLVICNIVILSATLNDDVNVLRASDTSTWKNQSTNQQPLYLHDHLGMMLKNNERADVTFEVYEEVFHAHKLILAARSPVFCAELFGPMNENNTDNIKVNEMEPRVFKAMLHFIYTDMLPKVIQDSNGDSEESNQMNSIEMGQHLLVAADRYALQRLKLICETRLSENITIDTVGTTLALAEQHDCPNLKNRCLEYVTLPQNFTKFAVTDGYRHLLLSCPTIMKELGDKLGSITM